jgi:hypothetical protein
MPVVKEQARAFRGGHEMKKIFNVQPRIPSAKNHHPIRDVSSEIFFKYGHSSTLTKHDYSTCDKYKSRDKPVLKQRYVGYPVSVPDIAAEAVNETMFRQTSHKKFLEEDKKLFRKKFFAECTSDYFNQSHLIRHYLNTMHPYSDPKDRGRTYSASRLKSNHIDIDPMVAGDFLNPKDPIRPRSTGYSAGHTRTILGLDSFGPSDSKRLELARLVGELPASPNVDREKVISISKTGLGLERSSSPMSARSNSTVSTAPGDGGSRNNSRGGRRPRPKTMGTLDNADMYLPPNMYKGGAGADEDGVKRSHNYTSSNQKISEPDFDNTLESTQSAASLGIVSGTRNETLGMGHETDAQRHGFDPMPETTPGEKVQNAYANSRGEGHGHGQRAATAGVTIMEHMDYDQRSHHSRNSRTSRGGIQPPGVPKPPHDTTQTGTLGYHGQAIVKEDIIMKDPIGRGIEWYNNRSLAIKENKNRAQTASNNRRNRLAIQKDINCAINDFNKFEIALEFRRTAKPADLPENNTKRSKMKAAANVSANASAS